MPRGGDDVSEHKGTRIIRLQTFLRANLIQNTLKPDNEVLAHKITEKTALLCE
jgi:hypothetical protein